MPINYNLFIVILLSNICLILRTYYVDMKRLVFASALIVISSVSYAEDSALLKCKFTTGWERFYLVEPEKELITLVGTDDGVKCKLTIKPHLYEWECAATSAVPAQVGKVNRYTGEYETEFGKKPFGQFKDGNGFAVGTCSKQKAERLF